MMYGDDISLAMDASSALLCDVLDQGSANEAVDEGAPTQNCGGGITIDFDTKYVFQTGEFFQTRICHSQHLTT